MIRCAVGLFLVVLGIGAAPGATPEKKDSPRIVLLAPQAVKKPPSPLAYRLLPDPLDQVEGNAAMFWVRAGMACRAVRHKWTDKQEAWSHPDGTPLNKLPIKEVKAVLDKYTNALVLADRAALRTRCDWEWPAPTVQTLATDLPLDEIQSTRQLAQLLTIRTRRALAEGKFDEALKTLQTGFALVRHLGQGNTMIQDLVAIAIGAIMLGQIEEWVQVPGSPNLYWALTELPRPLVDVRHSIRIELNTIYRSFPELRKLKQKGLSPEEARRHAENFFESWARYIGWEMPAWMKKVSGTAVALKSYPTAKKGLIATGRSAKEVEKMPALQVVAVYYLEQYDQARDEILQCLALPAWQGHAALEKVAKKLLPPNQEEGNVLIRLLMPALTKVYSASLRTERHIAGLRGAEALRLYVAAKGKVPAKWSDLTVPGPIDSYMGKGLEAWYQVKDSKAVLAIPPPPGMPALLGRRYEMTARPEGEKK